MMRLKLICACLLLFGGCASPQTTTADVGKPSDKMTNALQPLTSQQIEVLNGNISKCWNLPYEAINADFNVKIRVIVNRDGTLHQAEVIDQSRMSKDGLFRLVAHSALRAIKNAKCQPWQQPKEKYSQWKNMTLSFNPASFR